MQLQNSNKKKMWRMKGLERKKYMEKTNTVVSNSFGDK
jgi:hypothetical protein